MCCNYSVINESNQGMLVFLKGCKKYQLTFKNLCFSLNHNELITLHKFLMGIDSNYWEKEYSNSIYSKKIPIPTLQSNFLIMIDEFELFELQHLTKPKNKKYFICFKKPIFPMNWN